MAKLLKVNVETQCSVVLTPIVKGNEIAQRNECKDIMNEVIRISQTDEIKAKSILVTQFRSIKSYKFNHYEGIFDALELMSKSSFKQLIKIVFHIEMKHYASFTRHITYRLQGSTKIKNLLN